MRNRGAAGRPVPAALALLASLTLSGVTTAQETGTSDSVPVVRPARTVALLGAVALATPLLTDGNGTRVRLAPAPMVGVRVPLGTVADALHATATLRVGASAVRLGAGDAHWTVGHALQLELMAGAEWRPDPRAAVRASVGAVWIPGPRDVAPFSASRAPYPAAELGVSLRKGERSRTALELAAQGLRVSPRPGNAGGVLRVLLGLSHAL